MNELKTYKDILDASEGEYINYNTLLNTLEWNAKSKEIKKRDNYTCQKCKTQVDPNSKTDIIFKGNFGATMRVIEMVDNIIIDKEVLPRLEVHHTYYIINRLPWEYDEALITVCHRCHEKIHKNESIEVYRINNGQKSLTNEIESRCYRCNGTGFMKQYSHVENGICFNCRGNKTILFYKEEL